jgi:drug/metabolite transporter (DMT)-like permease
MIKIKTSLFWICLLGFDTVAQLLIKIGAVQSVESRSLDWHVLAGYACVIGSFLVWMQILKSTRLSLALSATSLNYVTVALGAHFFLHEPLPTMLIVGCALISAGVFVLGTGADQNLTGTK